MATGGRIEQFSQQHVAIRCKGGKACVWPVARDGLCVHHYRDSLVVEAYDENAEGRVLSSFKPHGRLRWAYHLLAHEHYSVRTVSRTTGVHRLTVTRLARQIQADKDQLCGCGRTYQHRGRCSWRRKGRLVSSMIH